MHSPAPLSVWGKRVREREHRERNVCRHKRQGISLARRAREREREEEGPMQSSRKSISLLLLLLPLACVSLSLSSLCRFRSHTRAPSRTPADRSLVRVCGCCCCWKQDRGSRLRRGRLGRQKRRKRKAKLDSSQTACKRLGGKREGSGVSASVGKRELRARKVD